MNSEPEEKTPPSSHEEGAHEKLPPLRLEDIIDTGCQKDDKPAETELIKEKPRQRDKFIEVSQAKLIQFITSKCSYYFYSDFSGACCYKKAEAKTCELTVYGKELQCPADCPRLNTKREFYCERGRCQWVRAIIKKLKTLTDPH